MIDNLEEMTFIHYGSNSFDEEMFCEICNVTFRNKPFGGLWSSPEGYYTWKEWCEGNSFHLDRLKESFRFKLKPNAKVLVLYNAKDLESLPRIKEYEGDYKLFNEDIDFEAISKEYDAILVFVYAGEDYFDNLYQALYGWDCDTLLVMNKDVIEVI